MMNTGKLIPISDENAKGMGNFLLILCISHRQLENQIHLILSYCFAQSSILPKTINFWKDVAWNKKIEILVEISKQLQVPFDKSSLNKCNTMRNSYIHGTYCINPENMEPCVVPDNIRTQVNSEPYGIIFQSACDELDKISGVLKLQTFKEMFKK